jgi:hypothetical protein
MAGHSATFQIPPASQKFQDLPQFSGFMKPCRFEGEVQNLEVVGIIPKEIHGTFFRVMPDPALPPYIENDPVSLLLEIFSPLHKAHFGSGLTAMALSARFISEMEFVISNNAMCGRRSLRKRERQEGL